MRAEPNLTPLLDVVFQLITFFMLVINFSNENYDARVRLPVAGSARPVEEGEKGERGPARPERRQARPPADAGEVMPQHQALREIKHQADLVKLNLKAAGVKPAGRRQPADHDRPPRRPRHAVLVALQPDHRLPDAGLPQVRPEGDERDLSGRSAFPLPLVAYDPGVAR